MFQPTDIVGEIIAPRNVDAETNAVIHTVGAQCIVDRHVQVLAQHQQKDGANDGRLPQFLDPLPWH